MNTGKISGRKVGPGLVRRGGKSVLSGGNRQKGPINFYFALGFLTTAPFKGGGIGCSVLALWESRLGASLGC